MDLATDPSYPLLSTIDSPADLRRLPVDSLPQVCDEIRRFLIDSLSVNPGHFASSMGAVELTVALHYVFDTPYDRIVWDVGHQAYGHKLLTGRRDRFDTNRKLGGLSGFPNPAESEYDTFTAGHASNSISAALGMAVASRLKGESPRRNVVAVIGDASISGGLAFEGINNAANTPNNLLIILNDNDMSIDRNVGSLNSYLAHLTASRGYNNMRFRIYKLLKRLHLVSERRRGALLRFNNSLKSLLTRQQNLFEGLNIRYFGPFDGHDLPTVIKVLNDIRDMDGPRILHLRTVKGRGYAPAEANPASWHAPGRFDPATGVRACDRPADPSTPALMKFQDVMGRTLLELARRDDRIVAITAAMLSGTSISVMNDALPHRTFDVGISEGHAVTMAGGLAKDGMRPVVGIYSSFLQRAFDNAIHDVAIQHLPVLLCVDRAGIVGEDGATHHGTLDLAYLRVISGFTVAAPRSAQWLRDLMYTALTDPDPGPVAIRYPRGNAPGSDLPDAPMKKVRRGCADPMRQGSDVTVLTIGPVAYSAMKAAERASAMGVEAEVIDMVYVKPLDADTLTRVAESGRPVITVEDGVADGGMGSAVLEWMNARGFTQVRVTRLGIPDRFVAQGTVDQLHKLCGFDEESIFNAIMNASRQ